ncbi:hypothetical protein [Kordiimonas sp.]|uniref:hypothetical protein n=1 Tax=Kordiimonas sp. TaxID=1970157 RepID=UPI003A9505E8
MLRTRTGRLLLLLMGALAAGSGLKAMTAQDIKDVRVSQEVEADHSVPFPVDI